ncbi:MAG: hypothetical protein KIPDCIKN_03817 [Haliscomenobacter sp.]|nr:hypothetical protein [Haliscomenobacter sp.]
MSDFERDSKGDAKIGGEPFDWSNFRKWSYTYIFKYFDEERGLFLPYFDIRDFDDEALEKSKSNPDCRHLSLYRSPDQPPYDFYIHYSNWQLGLLVKYFKEVFEEKSHLQGHHPNHKYSKIVLPQELYDKIINFINDFGLLPVRDLIFELIAIGQNFYVEKASFYERPEINKLISSAKGESEKVISLFEKAFDDEWKRNPEKSPPSDLLYVTFVFQDDNFKIEHRDLTSTILEQFKKHFDNLAYKDWRTDLERFPSLYKEDLYRQQFKYRLTKSFYNFLTQENFFILPKGQKTTNELMRCIVKLLEFSLISVGSPEELDSVKIKHVRNWVKRKDLEEDITFLSVDVNKEKLLKYFDGDFIGFGNETKRADVLNIAYYLAKRFDLFNLMPELAHIAECIKESSMLRGSQLLEKSIASKNMFPEKESFICLLDSIKESKKITSLKFKVEGDEEEYELQERLPLFLVEQAIRSHLENSKEEFDTDVIKSSQKKNSDGSITFIQEKRFNLPGERFAITFTKSFYDFLLNEAPPAENEFSPSKRYYAVIASMLNETWFFNNRLAPEHILVAKVESWHNLSQPN